jgi:hypothetical protein
MTTQNMIESAYSATPTASFISRWDANVNMSAVGFIGGYTTTATATSTTTLTVGSNQFQYFTGTLNQTLVMPVANTLVVGQYWQVVNNSTGVITIESSGGNTILALPASSETTVTCITASGTSAASWTTSPAVSGSGTVHSGTINDLAYYAATGTAVSPLTTANNGILVTSATGVPSISATFGQGLAVSSSELIVGGANNIPFNNGQGIQDSNGNSMLLFSLIASAVNYLSVNNAITGSAPAISAAGSDSNVGMVLSTKGTGSVTFESNNSVSGLDLLVLNPVASAVNYVTIASAATNNPPIISSKGSDTNVLLELNGQGTSGVAIQGNTAGSGAAAGYKGEIISSSVVAASGVSALGNNTATNITNIVLTAGNWLVFGNVTINPNNVALSAGTQLGWMNVGNSATLPDASLYASTITPASAGNTIGLTVPSQRVSSSGSTTVYLSFEATFGGTAPKGCGTIYAVRI